MKLGQDFVENGLVTEQQINRALQLQKKTGGKLGEILLAMTNLRALDYYKILAQHWKMHFVDLLVNLPDLQLLTENDHSVYSEKSCLPIAKENDILTVATADPSAETFDFIKSHWGENTRIVCTSKFDILWTLQQRFSKNYVDEAVNKLVNENVAFSARELFSPWQLVFLALFACILLFFEFADPINFLIMVNVVLTFTLSGTLLYKIMLASVGFLIKFERKEKKLKLLPEKFLPVYSILVPIYKEKEDVLRNLFTSLNEIEYPRHLLDIKILVEQDDESTIAALKRLNLPSQFEFIYVPFGEPRTKAKACNYGLKFARGEYLTLYDAEDRPDPYQLKIAFYTFQEYKHTNLACVQSRLNFYNSSENWLTRMFTIEYTYWFDLLLPALEYMGTPIPLGGTSNHFRTDVLKDIDAWDPYNVAEDADIGIRLHRLGYTSKVISSTTYEEANCQLWSWIKQRSRWVKGYMQTFIVHMRNPFKLLRTLGVPGFIGFQLFIGGTILSNLSNIVLWVIFFLLLLPSPVQLGYLFPKSIIFLAWFNFIVGTVGVVVLNLLGILRRRQYGLLIFAITAPLYWLLMSIASYRALFQLFFKPSYWDKTEHGISKVKE